MSDTVFSALTTGVIGLWTFPLARSIADGDINCTGNMWISGNETVAGNFTITGIVTWGATDGITAHAGGGQASATPLTSQLNNVSTVATAGDSVLLPASAPGLQIVLINSATKPVQVFGTGTDTINGIAAATGMSQPPSSMLTYICTAAGVWRTETPGVGFSGQFPTVSATNSITAHAGGGQGSAVPLTTVINRVTTVGTAGDSVLLPPSAPGMELIVINAAASNSMNVFPTTGDAINALAANTAFAVAANKTVEFYCAVAGTWHSILTA